MPFARTPKKSFFFALSACILLAAPASAANTFFATPRAMGMGGAGVASVDDTSAQYYNPAVFGAFNSRNEAGERIGVDNNDLGRKGWGADLGGSAGYRLLNDFGFYAQTLEDIEPDELKAGLYTESDLESLINLSGGLEGIASSDSAVQANVTTGFGTRVSNYALGGRGFFSAVGRVDNVDTANLGFEVDSDELANQIDGVSVTGFSGEGYEYSEFSSEQREQLAGALGVSPDADAIKKLDFIASNQEIKDSDKDGAVDLLTTAIEGSGDGSLEKNTTSVLLTGFGVGEIAASYGHAINDRWLVGGNLKFMQGRVYGNRVVVFDDDADDIVAETDENYKETNTFGIDLGVMARFNKFNVGVMGRNLNSPKFDGFSGTTELTNGESISFKVDDVKLKPQVTAGVAYFPLETLALAADLDLLENETLLSGYDSRRLSLGVEWDAFRVLALRAGAYRNLSESDIGVVYTAGIGLNLWAARLDIAGAISGDSEEYDDEDVPSEGRVSAEISVDF